MSGLQQTSTRSRPRPDTGVFAQPDQDPPLNALFRQLRDVWVAQGEGRSFAKLATLLSDLSRARRGRGIVAQNVAQWATGSDGRRPPWWIIMVLCEATGYRVVGDARSWRIERVEQQP